ncbi:nucleotide pyrophosphohydrolase [Chromobacterium vaccinii]|uniref:nucleotide pyrophosphohydrolase n=1 Tax=Chromobacterium vaccinii TaxID=1108595 RepID=UPI001E525E9B|nr:nucleotide pyrophosphohydrolase [Chromobacterium vaccinii]MCD4498501.1 nucleotide pyrophosphohydrolase [Chromobacterium vaccinii]
MTQDKLIDVGGLTAALQRFADERDWNRHHSPRNLLLALVGEVGELAEIFQWLDDDAAARLRDDPAKFTHLQEEIADVLLYLTRLAMVTGVDLDEAVRDKMVKNAIKYPVA